MHAFLSNLANRQTDRQRNKQTRAKTCTSSFVGGKNSESRSGSSQLIKVIAAATNRQSVCDFLLAIFPTVSEIWPLLGVMPYENWFRHSYYGMLIGTRMRSINGAIFNDPERTQRQITRLIVSRVWSIRWFRLQWLWVTRNLDFKVTV